MAKRRARRAPAVQRREPEDPLDRIRARRRAPDERWLSRTSGLLLLVMLAQAAFGYAMVGLATAAWVRTTHLLLAFIVAGLAVAVWTFARRLPWGGRRELVLQGLSVPLLFLVFVQLVIGAMARGWFPGYSADVRNAHVGLGLLVMLLVTIMHILAIGPSLLLSARREYEAGREEFQRQ